MKLYENIKQRRLELGITQQQLANMLGYSDKSAIAKIEKGVIDLPHSKILAFAKALNTTLTYLTNYNETNPCDSSDVYETTPYIKKILSSLETMSDDELKQVNDYIEFIIFKRKDE